MFRERKTDDTAWISQNNEEKYISTVYFSNLMLRGDTINIGNNHEGNINGDKSHDEFKRSL